VHALEVSCAGALGAPGLAPPLHHTAPTAKESIPWVILDRMLPPGSLYQRVIDRLIGQEITAQAARLRARGLTRAHHPWYPVLSIGLSKLELYTRAIRSDLEGRTALLSDPDWLLRVGRYLELLTCLGIAEAVRAEGFALLSEAEQRLLEEAPELALVRAHLDMLAWRAVWKESALSSPWRMKPLGGPGAIVNLLRKRRASLAFLAAHHADLRQAIALAGPERGGGPRTWRRVLQDTERTLLQTAAHAFPELAGVPACVRDLLLWREAGDLGVAFAPRWLAQRLGDQDGLYASASRAYRRSMNEVARWARARDLMSFAGAECIPPEASLVEGMLAQRASRAARRPAPSRDPRARAWRW
jgi:hypothetical protein